MSGVPVRLPRPGLPPHPVPKADSRRRPMLGFINLASALAKTVWSGSPEAGWPGWSPCELPGEEAGLPTRHIPILLHRCNNTV